MSKNAPTAVKDLRDPYGLGVAVWERIFERHKGELAGFSENPRDEWSALAGVIRQYTREQFDAEAWAVVESLRGTPGYILPTEDEFREMCSRV